MAYYNHTTSDKPNGFELNKIPYHFQFDDMNSQFVRFYAFIGNQIDLQILKAWYYTGQDIAKTKTTSGNMFTEIHRYSTKNDY